MAGPLPHTTQVQEMMEGYLDDAEKMIDDFLRLSRGSSNFRSIYRISLAADAVLSKLATRKTGPGLQPARSIVLRIPLLVAVGQTSVASVELRRFLEILFWYMYFAEHPVEWTSFKGTPGKAYGRTLDAPIYYCAHREMAFYVNYALERMESEPSGIAKQAITELRKTQGQLNAVVHPGVMATTTTKTPPFDDLSPADLAKFQIIQRCVFSNGCLVVAAFCRKQFDSLPSMHRAHFDWLIGTSLAKRIRSGPFGLTL